MADAGERAKEAASTAKDVAGDVTADAKEQVRQVAGQMSDEARRLYDTTRREFKDQAEARTHRAADELRSLSQQVRALTEARSEQAGRLPELAREAERRLSDLAGRIDARGLDGVLYDVRRFARQRPGVFIAICAGTGFFVGRMARAARDGNGGHNGQLPRPVTDQLEQTPVLPRPVESPAVMAPASPAAPQAGSAAV